MSDDVTPRGPSRSRLVLECEGGTDEDETLVVHEDTYVNTCGEPEPIVTVGLGGSDGNYVDNFRWLDHESARALYDWLGASLRRNARNAAAEAAYRARLRDAGSESRT